MNAGRNSLPAAMVSMPHSRISFTSRSCSVRWQQNPDMIRKHMIFDLASGKGGGIYLWTCVEDAQRWHDESFRQRVLSAFGSEPSYQYFDTPVIVDNAARDIMIEAA